MRVHASKGVRSGVCFILQPLACTYQHMKNSRKTVFGRKDRFSVNGRLLTEFSKAVAEFFQVNFQNVFNDMTYR